MNYNDGSGPFEKDTMESREAKESRERKESESLLEKDFIQEPPRRAKGGLPIWLWLFLATIVAALVWGEMSRWDNWFTKKEVGKKPFLEVTNREMSVFLWQFPDFMRSRANNKTGYLPGFQYMDKDTLKLDAAGQFAAAPPDLLFLYHTWSRLLSNEVINRPIPPNEFMEFLGDVEGWKPQNWKEAPQEYVQLANSLATTKEQDLQTLPESSLPKAVRQSFIGWKNYNKEAPQINELHFTYQDVQDFINQHPNYARNFWRNIGTVHDKKVAGLNYLKGLESKDINPSDLVPPEQLALFLELAVFNAQQAAKGQ